MKLRVYAPRTSERLSEDLGRFADILQGRLDNQKRGGIMLDRAAVATVAGLLDEASRRNLEHRVDDEMGQRAAEHTKRVRAARYKPTGFIETLPPLEMDPRDLIED